MNAGGRKRSSDDTSNKLGECQLSMCRSCAGCRDKSQRNIVNFPNSFGIHFCIFISRGIHSGDKSFGLFPIDRMPLPSALPSRSVLHSRMDNAISAIIEARRIGRDREARVAAMKIEKTHAHDDDDDAGVSRAEPWAEKEKCTFHSSVVRGIALFLAKVALYSRPAARSTSSLSYFIYIFFLTNACIHAHTRLSRCYGYRATAR